MNRILYGAVNPNMDAELEAEIREQHPSWNDKKVLQEMKKIKVKATMFNKKNNKKNSTKKPKSNNGNNPQPKDN